MGTRYQAIGVGLLTIAVFAVACDVSVEVTGEDGNSGAIEGSGNIESESRQVSGFDEIVLLGGGDVIVEVTGTESLTVETDDNVLPLLSTDVEGGVLQLGTGPGVSISPSSIEYRITVADLAAVTILGGGGFLVSGVDTSAFSVTIAGAGDVEASGSATQLLVQITGTGGFDGEALAASEGSVSIPGRGTAVVNVSDELDVSIAGSGNVEYIGTPVLSTSIPGSGDVSQR